MRRHVPTLAASLLTTLALVRCTADCPDPTGDGGGTDGGATDGGATDGGAAESGLTEEQLQALDTWVPTSVEMSPYPGGPVVTGRRLAILVDSIGEGHLDLVTTGTRAQDYNSSRSNTTTIVSSEDDLFDEDTSDPNSFAFAWDGDVVCTVLPCSTSDKRDGASSHLSVQVGKALDDGLLALGWAHTTPMDSEFSGTLTLGIEARDGHVTVLKASSTPDGDIVITSAMESETMAIFDGDTVVYEGKPGTGTVPLAIVSGTTGASWPKGFSIEETPVGTLVSLTW
jgi:hypothetical protein